MRRLVISDIHGGHKALTQVLERSGFDNDSDQLIFLGDVCDGWREVWECIQTLSDVNNLIGLLGNHDQWAIDWLENHRAEKLWLNQGGRATVNSLRGRKQDALDFLKTLKPYHKHGSQLFVHGGINPDGLVEDEDIWDLTWDREMIQRARYDALSTNPTVINYGEVFCGHTPTINFGNSEPVKYSNVWAIDTGASYNGCLSMIDADTKEVWQSDPVFSLYPGEVAR